MISEGAGGPPSASDGWCIQCWPRVVFTVRLMFQFVLIGWVKCPRFQWDGLNILWLPGHSSRQYPHLTSRTLVTPICVTQGCFCPHSRGDVQKAAGQLVLARPRFEARLIMSGAQLSVDALAVGCNTGVSGQKGFSCCARTAF
jgi:hypothetical protein